MTEAPSYAMMMGMGGEHPENQGSSVNAFSFYASADLNLDTR